MEPDTERDPKRWRCGRRIGYFECFADAKHALDCMRSYNIVLLELWNDDYTNYISIPIKDWRERR